MILQTKKEPAYLVKSLVLPPLFAQAPDLVRETQSLFVPSHLSATCGGRFRLLVQGVDTPPIFVGHIHLHSKRAARLSEAKVFVGTQDVLAGATSPTWKPAPWGERTEWTPNDWKAFALQFGFQEWAEMWAFYHSLAPSLPHIPGWFLYWSWI